MLKNFLKDETGAELAEYAVGVALLVAIGLIVYKVLGNAINQSNSETGSDIKTAPHSVKTTHEMPGSLGFSRLPAALFTHD